MKKQLIYWRGSAEVRTDLIKAIADRGFELKHCRTFEEVLDILAHRVPEMLIVDGSAGEREASDRIVELSTTERLFNVPTFFLCVQANKRAGVLKGRFSRFFAIDMPFQVERLVSQLESVLNNTGDTVPLPDAEPAAPVIVPEVHSSSVDAEVSGASTSTSATPPKAEAATPRASNAVPSAVSGRNDLSHLSAAERDQRALAEAHELERREDKRKRVIELNRDPHKLVGSYGGKFFALASSAGDFDDDVLLAKHPKRQALEKSLAEISKDQWLGAHARRVTYLSAVLSEALGIGPERDQNLRSVAVVLNHGLRDAERDLAEYDPIRAVNASLHGKLADGFEMSAQYIASNIDRGAAQLCTTIGALTRGTEQGSANLLQDARCALLVEFADRACWKDGQWNHYGAYRMLRFLQSGELLANNQRVSAPLMRILGEAVCSRPSVVNYLPSDSDANMETEPADAGSRRLTVRIPNLMPGMKLAEPLLSVDGRVVLDANVRLDEDLVFHLWQLAAIRVLRSSVAIERSV